MMKHSDSCYLKIKGEWWDHFKEYDPTTGLLLREWDTPVKTNIKMDAVAILVAALFANDGTLTGGFLHHAQGRGDGAWVEPTIPAANPADTTLLDEAGRKAIGTIVFLDAFDVPTLTRTNVIRVSTTYSTADLAGETLREQAIFGGDSTLALDSGIIVNTIRHTPFFKSGAAELTRNIKFTIT